MVLRQFRSSSSASIGRLFAPAILSLILVPTASAQLVISEFRLRGPNGGNDEFVELHNNTDIAHTVAATGTGIGYSVASSDAVVRCIIPDGTVIPARGHYLCVNTIGYSLSAYPAGNATTATGDATYVNGIDDDPLDLGIALFSTNVPGEYALATRLDAVGSTQEVNTLYKEGAGLLPLVAFAIDYAWVRDVCGKGGSIVALGPCPDGGLVIDTNDNAADFIFVDTLGTSAGGGQRIGAPGPENLGSPLFGSAAIADAALDPCVGDTLSPNIRFDGQSLPAQNSTFGAIDFRRTFTNNTGSPITRMRLRVIDQTTFPAPSGFADLRGRTSSATVVNVDRAPCGSGTSDVTVQGTDFETPPAQSLGGGFNSSYSAATITLATPLANGAAIDLRVLFGIQQHGQYKVGMIVETLPLGGNAIFEVEGCTDGCTGELQVLAVARLDPSPTPPGSVVDYRVTFNRSLVGGVDGSDFVLATTGTLAGAFIAAVVAEGVAVSYIVTVNTGTGTGTLRLDVVDDDSITQSGDPLGGAGAGNGGFNTGEIYAVSDPPVVLSITRIGASPTSAAAIQFTVTFSESVTGVDATDFVLTTTGTVAPAITNVSGTGATRIVTVSTGGGIGTIRLDLIDDDSIVDLDGDPLAGAGNGSFAAGEQFAIGGSILEIPVLDPRATALLALLLASAAVVVLRQR